MNAEMQRIYVPYPYALEGENIGGLASVIDAERVNGAARFDQVTFITSDNRNGTIKGVNVLAAAPESAEDFGKPMSRRMWHTWCTLHPEAYTSIGAPPEALDRMYLGEYKTEPYGIARMSEHTDTYGPSERDVSRFHKRYEALLREIPEGSIVNFQDFVWFAGIRDFGPALKERGCNLIGYGHTEFPDTLTESAEGRRVLSSISHLDKFLAHSDVFLGRVEGQLKSLGLKVPEFARFDLGIDMGLIDNSLRNFDPMNFRDAFPGYRMLPASQQEFIQEIFKAQLLIPHNFLCIDRIDPIKGLDTVLKGIEGFLDTQLKNGQTPEDLKNNFRFFFVNLPVPVGVGDPYNLSYQYAKWLDEQFEKLMARPEFEGVIHRGDPIKGEQRIAFPSMMRNMNMISGGRGEGLHLSFMEALYVNRGRPVAGILPSGAGFAQQAVSQGYSDPTIFPVPNDESVYQRAIEDIVRRQRVDRDGLTADASRIVDELIMPRRDSVLFGN